MNVFIDESGDLGFSKKATKYFIICFFMCENKWPANGEIKRLLKKVRTTKKYGYKHGELKFSKSSEATRIFVLNKIMELSPTFGTIILHKKKVHRHLRNDLNYLYRIIVINNVMEMALPYLGENEKMHIKIDKCFSQRKLQLDFNQFVEKSGYYYSRKVKRQVLLYKNKITTEHLDSQNEPCLQIADYLAGSEFHHYENKKYQYFDIIKPHIKDGLYRFLW